MNTASPSIFISYSHRRNGPAWKAALIDHLAVLSNQHLVEAWDDEQIPGGWRWESEIELAIHTARLAVILLTKEALESEFILERELAPLSRREKEESLVVIPILCEPCAWHEHSWLKQVQIRPFEAKPLSSLDKVDTGSTLRRLASEIAKELGRAARGRIAKSDPPGSAIRLYLDKLPLARRTGQREEKLIGREQELALLDLAFAQPQTAIVSLVAWGGVGKSMLVRHWLQRLERGGWPGARRVYAWSFYSQGTEEDRQASEDTFLADALAWFGVECRPTLSPWEKGRLLADAIVSEPTLLILDGIEPLQYPPGPMGGQLRAPGVQSLLKQLARKASSPEHRGLCLVTTRESLSDLADFQRHPHAAWGSALRVDLGNLTDEAGAALLHQAGANRAGAAETKPDDKELFTASRDVDGHALTLTLLGRFLARAHGGDIRRRDLVKFAEADRTEQGGTTFKMLAAFENWFARSGEFGARQLAVLRILGLFDRPADAGCIGALRKPPVIAELTDPLFTKRIEAVPGQATVYPLVEEDWNTATSFLADFGLLVNHANADSAERLLDCHPLVREHFCKCLKTKFPNAWHDSNLRLYEYLRDHTEDRPMTLVGLQPLFQAITHGCRAGAALEARTKVFRDRIQRRNDYFATKQLGAFGDELNALACFFTKPWDQVTSDLPIQEQWLVQNQAAQRLRACGRLGDAVLVMRHSSEQCKARLPSVKDAAEMRWWIIEGAVSYSNLVEVELLLGRIQRAIMIGIEGLKYAVAGRDGGRNIDRYNKDIVSYCDVGQALFYAGDHEKADEAFQMANLSSLYAPMEGFRYSERLLAHVDATGWQLALGIKPANAALKIAKDAALRVETRSRQTQHAVAIAKQGPLADAVEHLTLGRTLFYAAMWGKSDNESTACEIEAAVQGFRQAGVVEHLPHGLLTRAWLRFRNGDAEGARADLDEAWDIAERGPMRLHQTDIHLYRARLFFQEQTYPWKSAPHDLAAAEKLINECGYHRRDEELADAKLAILGEYSQKA
jgi:tetratricopeptide (TPR) repeat protein